MSGVETKDDKVHTGTDTDVHMLDVSSHQHRRTSCAWRCEHIPHVDRVNRGAGREPRQRQETAAVYPRIHNGIWRAALDAPHGACVLLTQHASEPAAANTETNPTERNDRQVQPHPHLLNLYGAHDDTLSVCEDGSPFREFVTVEHNYKSVLSVFYHVLLGLRFMHDLGFAHGAVDAKHIVVAKNDKGKLLAHIPMDRQSKAEPFKESAAEEEAAKEAAKQQQQLAELLLADELSFVSCMKSEIGMLLDRGDVERESVELLGRAVALLNIMVPGDNGAGVDEDDAMGAEAVPRRLGMQMSRAVLKLKKLTEFEAGGNKQSAVA